MERRCELGELFLLREHHLHYLKGGQDAVSCRGILAENNVSRLLSADAVAILLHRLIDVFVADLRPDIINAGLLQRLKQAVVRLGRRNDGVLQKLSPLLHVARVHIKDVISRDHIALLVHGKAAVCIPVIGKAHIQTIVTDKILQLLNMRGADIPVDVESVRPVTDQIGLRSKSVEDSLGNGPAAAVCAVKSDLHAAEIKDAERNQITDVTIPARDVIDGRSDLLPFRKRKILPFPSKARKSRDLSVSLDSLQYMIQPVLNQRDGLIVHLLAHPVHQLDAVVMEGIVACRDHHAAVKAIHSRDITDRGCRRHVQKIRIRSACHQPSDQ